MDDSHKYDSELSDLQAMASLIQQGRCILVLGPRVDIRPDDPERTPLDELAARELLQSIGPNPGEGTADLRRIAELDFRQHRNPGRLTGPVARCYRRCTGLTTPFHRDLAALPFSLCLSASPADLMLVAFQEAGKTPQKGYYNFAKPNAPAPQLSAPTENEPLVYHLFGHYDDATSLVLTEGDLINYLIAVVKGQPQIPDEVRNNLGKPEMSFLFLGFGFQNWYLRVLLQGLNILGHDGSMAFEDKQFFEHPDREQTVGFFSDAKRLVPFHELRWEQFAKQLREMYEEVEREMPKTQRQAPPKSVTTQPAGNAPPKVFLSYASEDRNAVTALAQKLQSYGVDVWQDVQNLRGGDDWNRVLTDVIEHRCDYVIPVQTPAMTSRIEGVFNGEIDRALDRQKNMGERDGKQLRFLIPIRIGSCPRLSKLSNLHEIDAGTPDGVEALVQAIREDWQERSQPNLSQAVHA